MTRHTQWHAFAPKSYLKMAIIYLTHLNKLRSKLAPMTRTESRMKSQKIALRIGFQKGDGGRWK